MLSVRELATKLCVNPETVRRWIRSGELQTEQIGQEYFVSKDALHLFLKKHPKYNLFYQETDKDDIYLVLSKRVNILEMVANGLQSQYAFIQSEIADLKCLLAELRKED